MDKSGTSALFLASKLQNTKFNFIKLLNIATPKVVNSISEKEIHPTVLMNIIEQHWDQEILITRPIFASIDARNVRYYLILY